MTNQELANKLNTMENRAEYRKAEDKAIFIQSLIEAENIKTSPDSELVEFVEAYLMW